MDKKEEFVSRITEEYGVNCGICDVDKKIFHSELRGGVRGEHLRKFR